MEQQHIKTPTEIAFEKAKEYDAILGFTVEHLAFEKPCSEYLNWCSERIMVRYRLEIGTGATLIIAHLEQYLKMKSDLMLK